MDRKKLKNPNGLILGTPGSGKSFSAKREITNAFLVTDDDIIICDPEAEYAALVHKFEGQVIKISSSSTNYINPMDININYSEDDNPVALKADFILSLCELIMGSKDGLQPIEKTVIDRCVHQIKRLCAAFLAAVLCMSVFSTTALAYTDETAASGIETVETAPAETTEQETEEVPYSVSVDEDGTVVFSFNGEDWKYDAEKTEDDGMGTGKVVTNGSRLNVRTGAGMNYEIIDQLRPGEEVKVIGVDGDWYQITVPEKNGYVHSDYLELIEEAEQNSEMDMALLMMFMNMFMQNMDTGADASESALTPDGNLTLVDDVGSPDKTGKQFITAVTKNGNYFYIIIDRDDEGNETVHFLNQVDEADLLMLMSEEEAAKYTEPVVETTPEPTETEPEPKVTEPAPEEKPKTNMLPVVLLVVALIGGGGFFVFKKMQGKKKEKEAAKPDPDADYVDDDEDYGYVEEDDDDADFIVDDEDNEPV